MVKLSRENIQYFFDKSIKPAISVLPGEILELETEDAIGGQLTYENIGIATHAEMRTNIPCSNPVTGPIYIQGVKEGDYLEIEILEVNVEKKLNYAWTIFDGKAGLLTNCETINPSLKEENRIISIEDNSLIFMFKEKNIKIPIRPAIGTIGVAPKDERRYSYFNGCDFLGNVDLPSLGEGKTLVLKINSEGALLSLGDVHARSGQGEISSGAADCRGVVKIKVDIYKKSDAEYINLPQLNCQDFIGSIGVGMSLESVIKIAYRDLIFRMSHNYQLSIIEAYQLLSTVGEIEIGQLIPPRFFSALIYVKKEFLK